MAAPTGLIVGWLGANGSIPAGWSRVTALDSRAPMGSTTAASTGGANTHNHPETSHSHQDTHSHSSVTSGAFSGTTVTSFASTVQVADDTHTHAVNFVAQNFTAVAHSGSTSSSAVLSIPYYQVIFIKADGTTDIPVNALAYWPNGTGTIPSPWAYANGTGTTDLRGTYLRGAAAGADSGTSQAATPHNHTLSHSHSATSHAHTTTHGAASTIGRTAGATPAYGATHGHTEATYNNTSSGLSTDSTVSQNQTHEPPYFKLHHIQKTGTSSTIQGGIIAMWDGLAANVPALWNKCDGTKGTPNLNGGANNFIKGSSADGEQGSTGGATTHTHTGAHTHQAAAHTHTNATGLSNPTTTAESITGASTPRLAWVPHTHTAPTSGAVSAATSGSGDYSLTSATNLPSYYSVIFIQATTPVQVDRTYKWNVSTSVQVDRTYKWNVSTSVQVDRTYKWGVAGPVTTDTTFKWNVATSVQIDRTYKWATGLFAVQVDTALLWQVLPGTQRIELALSGLAGRPVAYTFAYEKVDITGAFLSDVTAQVLSASFDLNNDREIVRAAQFVFVPGATGINFASDFIRAYMMLLVDGSTYVKIPIGQFSLNIPQNTYKKTHKEQAVQAAGMTVVLEQNGPLSPYYVAAGANVITTVRSICTDLGLNHRFVNSTKVTASANTWPNGIESWLDIVNDLLGGIDYYTCWDDDDGYITSRPTDDLAYRDPDIEYTDSAWILNDDIAEQIDETLPANQVVMIMRNPSLTALVSTKTNADPNSPISTVTLGRTIQARMESDLAVDQATLDAIAERYLKDQQDRYLKATITTPIDPRRTAREVYRVTVADAGYDGTLWRVRNWKFDAVTGAKMTHEISRTLPLVVT